MRTVDQARRECMAELRRRAELADRKSVSLDDFTDYQAMLVVRDAFLAAVEIVQTCFAGLEFQEPTPTT